MLSDAIIKATEDIKNKLANNQKLVAGSIQTKVLKETFSKNVGDQSDKLSLTQSVSADGLIYMDSELNKFIDEYLKEFVPTGFILSNQNRDVSIEVLGNSTNSVLTSSEADLQVTLKVYVVPDLNEEAIKKELAGKTISEAQNIVSSLRNVSSYKLELSPKVPFFDRVPKDLKRIQITIERN